MNCKCGHMMAIHDEGGCQHTDRTKDGIDLVCRCGLSPDAIAESKHKTLISLLSQVRTEYREYGNISGRLQRTIDNALSEEEKMDEKIIDGLNEAQWQARYVAYMKAHSNAEDWECEESAGIAWDESTDESPEECASEELSYWE